MGPGSVGAAHCLSTVDHWHAPVSLEKLDDFLDLLLHQLSIDA